VPRPHRHAHSGVRGRQPRRVVRGQLPRLRAGQDAPARNRLHHPPSHQIQEVLALMTEDWNARQYLKFEDERTRPPRDLLAQVPLKAPRRVIDLGCGPGNSTALLLERYPQAQVIGLDSSPDMLRQARERLPNCEFAQADLADWSPRERTDLLFANAVFQWVPDHPAVLGRRLSALPAGGVLAVQMPDNTEEPALALMREVATSPRWAAQLAPAAAARDDLPTPAAYYDLLGPLCAHLDIWHTVYNHVMAGPPALVEGFKGVGVAAGFVPPAAEDPPPRGP